ncbi:hypothetical protein POTOM_034638 [Populus tomentosa]|uniref:TF-B3 domain-containing protein n=1 Tax=Populus tomentosa TaxID=118781 RepID=A0A8X8CPN7_POPTO|nr:hypothetical protein POTOM_034638 [Populus tomentosa]
MAKSKQTYEEIRQKRMEENKKRMEELNLTKLSQSLLSKPSPVKKGKPRTFRPAAALTPVRRSTRVADRSTVSYKELPVETLERTRRSYSSRRRGFGVYASSEARAYAIDKAEQIQSRLGADFPSFLKPMVQSHVSGCFWLVRNHWFCLIIVIACSDFTRGLEFYEIAERIYQGLPVYFCKSHLPLSDEMMTLEDENGDEFQTKYLARKTGLSGGWRGFSLDHELVDGDALVFHLVSPTRFKASTLIHSLKPMLDLFYNRLGQCSWCNVYIARAYDSEDNENKEDMEEDNEGKENIDNDKNSDSKHLDGIAKRTRASNCFSTLQNLQKFSLIGNQST